MRKLNPKIIRIGDKLKIINPEFFIRCGYPITFNDACKKVEEKYKEKINNFIKDIGLEKIDYRAGRQFDKIVATLAYDYRNIKGFSGSERRIYTEKKEDYPCIEKSYLKVTNIKFVKTGDYFSSSGGFNSYTGESDWEPGGLTNERTHKILNLDYGWLFTKVYFSSDPAGDYEQGWIEAVNVEKII